jgi:hypothetical protein
MRNLHKKSLRSILVVTVAMLTMTPLTTGITTASAVPKEKPKVIVMYSETKSLVRVDTSAAGVDHGDLFHREDALSRKLNGPVIGVSYSQAEVISHNPGSNIDVRRVLIESILPKGRMFFIGTSELVLGTTPPSGWTNSYAITGGTGIYSGARGTMKLELLADGKSWKSTTTYTVN